MRPADRAIRARWTTLLLVAVGTTLTPAPGEAQTLSPSAPRDQASPRWFSVGVGGQFHLVGDQAHPLRASGESDPAATLRPGFLLEAEAGRTLRGLQLGLRGSWASQDHADKPGGFVVSGKTEVAQATLVLRWGAPDRRLGADVGGGLMYLRSENVLSPAGEVIGLPSVAVGTRVNEWAPKASLGLTFRIAGSDLGRSLGLRAGLELAATEEKVTVLAPVGLQVRFGR
jgi:hypothetical protein